MYSYQLFRLAIDSQIELPKLPSRSGGGPDATVEIVDEDQIDCVQHSVAGFGRLTIKNGSRLLVAPEPTASHDAVRRLLYGPGLRLLFHAQGAVAIHGSAVAVDDVAVAFLGDSGAGKSTTAAAFDSAGHTILADDLVAIPDPEAPVVYPGITTLRLDPQTADTIGFNGPITQNQLGTKQSYQATHERPIVEGYPLERLYVLETTDQVSIREIRPGEKLFTLMYHSHNAYSSDAFDEATVSAHFDQCGAITQTTTMSRLGRPRDLQSLPDVVEAVETNVRA